jgi:hypothetical protein
MWRWSCGRWAVVATHENLDVSQFFDALKAGARAAADALGPGRYAVADRRVRCAHCGGEQFALRAVSAAEVGAALGYGYALRCVGCTHVMLFGDAPQRE